MNELVRKLAHALRDQCRYMISIGKEPSDLAKEALGEVVLAGIDTDAELKPTKVQYFNFYLESFEASEICSILEPTLTHEWDFALVSYTGEEGMETSYREHPTKSIWITIGNGLNNYGFKFLTPGRHSYDVFPQYKHLGK
jgi:hypothetical protein